MGAVGARVEGLEEGDGFQVLAAAMDVGDPLSRRPAVVEVEHGSDRIDPEPVDVIAVEPEQRVGGEEVGNLAAAEVIDQGVPVAVEPEPRVLVLVERRAVEARQAVRVGREVRRHPVDQHPDAGLVAAVDEAGESLRRPEARRGRKEADRLVAPGPRERMLADRQQLDVREPQVVHIRDELVGQPIITKEAVAFAPAPGAGVHLVDRDGARTFLEGFASAQPIVVLPVDVRFSDDARCGGRRRLERECKGVALERHAVASRTDDLVLVECAFADARQKQLPDPGLDAPSHRVAAAVPGIEVAHDADAAGIGRPYREDDARYAVDDDRMCAEPLVEPLMAAFGEQMRIELTEVGRKPIGVVNLPAMGASAQAKLVGRRTGAMCDHAGIEALLMHTLERGK